MPTREPLSAQNEKHNGSGLWRVCSLEDILKILRWETTPTALETQANVLQSEKTFSTSVNGDANGGEAGLCDFRMPVHYPRYSKADYESMAEWKLDILLQQYGLPIRGDVASKRSYAMGAFLWPVQLLLKYHTVYIMSILPGLVCLTFSEVLRQGGALCMGYI